MNKFAMISMGVFTLLCAVSAIGAPRLMRSHALPSEREANIARPQSSDSSLASPEDDWMVGMSNCSIDVKSRLDVRLSDRSGEVIAHAQRDLMDTAPGASRPAGLKDAEEVLSHFFESLGASSSSDPARMMTMVASGVRMTTTDADGVTTKPFAMDSMFGIKATPDRHVTQLNYRARLNGNAYLVAPKCDAPNRRIVAFVSLAELGNADGDLYPSTTHGTITIGIPLKLATVDLAKFATVDALAKGVVRELQRLEVPATVMDGSEILLGFGGSAVPFLIVGSSSSETTLSAQLAVVDAPHAAAKGKSK